MNYQVVVGLEVHAQLLTESKLFSGEATQYGLEPNSQAGEITLALPGTLPMINKKAIDLAIRMGLACGCEISRDQIFDRKNYFYPDLPKGFQLTQHRTPVCRGGEVTIRTAAGARTVKLHHIHLEEDAGKLMHLANSDDTLVDLNRAGMPLIEIVSQPDLYSAEEAGAFLAEVRKRVRFLGICDGNMEEGSLRCDANVSVRLRSVSALGKKVEVKNMNSIKNLVRAIEFETHRQIEILSRGDEVASETRTFDAVAGKTFSMRTKETLNDYRYFPDPDLSPVTVSDAWLESIRLSLPELPEKIFIRFTREYGLPDYDAQVLTDEHRLAGYYEAVVRHTKKYKAVSNWLMGPVKEYLNSNPALEIPVPPETLARLIEFIDEGKFSFTVASQRIFPELVRTPHVDLLELAQRLDVLQNNDPDELATVIGAVIREFPLKVEEYKKGKKSIVQMFMGEVMKRTRGKADPQKSNELLVGFLNKS